MGQWRTDRKLMETIEAANDIFEETLVNYLEIHFCGVFCVAVSVLTLFWAVLLWLSATAGPRAGFEALSAHIQSVNSDPFARVRVAALPSRVCQRAPPPTPACSPFHDGTYWCSKCPFTNRTRTSFSCVLSDLFPSSNVLT